MKPKAVNPIFNRTIIGVWIGMLLTTSVLPLQQALPEATSSSMIQDSETYYLCYVNSSGTYHSLVRAGTWFRPNDLTLARKLVVQYSENAQTTLTRTKNGAELRQYEGTHELELWRFIGFLDYKARHRVSLHGSTVLVRVTS